MLSATALLVLSSLTPSALAQPAASTGQTATAPANPKTATHGDTTIADYFTALETAGLIDIDTGSRENLIRELDAAEKLLRLGNASEAAVALYAIVESPRFTALDDFLEYHNAEYDLAVALSTSGAYDSALTYLMRAMSRGPSSLYFSPAHRRAVNIALQTGRHQEILDMLTGLRLSEPIPTSAAGERAYLQARIEYAKGTSQGLRAAEAELTRISRKSRMYSSALYLRGIIQARRGGYRGAAEAFCEIAATPDDDKFTFVVDERYFRIKDLARLGLGRIAHEQSEYDDAYYHYFQIPEDSDKLPEALFEAAWSMYQKRELPTARDLSSEFLRNFPSSHLVPEAQLLRGYVELADCEFDAAQKHYDRLVHDLGPVVKEINRIRKSPRLRRKLLERASDLRRAERADPQSRIGFKAKNVTDRVLALLRVDPAFVRIHQAITGLRTAVGDTPHAVRAWSGLARNTRKRNVGAVGGPPTMEQEDAADANSILEDVRRLQDELVRARADLRRGVREKLLPTDVAAEEKKRLVALSGAIDALEAKARAAASKADAQLTESAAPSLAPMIRRDLADARGLRRSSKALLEKLTRTADTMATRALDKLYADTKRVLDKANLGKIDAVIGQKRRLDIEVSDLAAGRYPAELHGRLWEEGLIGDDEEFWPFEGEYWSDEYKGWR